MPTPEVEAADPRRDDRRLHPARPVDAPQPRGARPARGAAVGALAMTAPADRPRPDRRRRCFDPARTRGRGRIDLYRSYRTAASLGWQMEANWTDPVLFFIYSVAKPVAPRCILVVMLEVIAGPSGREYRGFVVVGSALWSFVISGIAGLAWSVLDDRERYRMLKYLYVSPSDFVVVLLGRGAARIAVGAMGAAITLASASSSSASRSTRWRSTGRCSSSSWRSGSRRSSRSGCSSPRSASRPARRRGRIPEAVAGALFLVSGAVFPLAVLPARDPGDRPGQPADLVARGRPARALPGRRERRRRARLAVHRGHRAGRARRRRRSSSPCSRPGRWLHSERPSPSARASAAPGIAGSSTGRPAPDGRPVGSAGDASRRTGLVRIYEGSPRQDFEEVFRSIGAFLDQRGMKDILLVEAPDGFIVQGLVSQRRRRGGLVRDGRDPDEGDPDLPRRRHRPVHGGGRRPAQPAAADDWSRAGYYEKAFRVLGRYMDEQKPRERSSSSRTARSSSGS